MQLRTANSRESMRIIRRFSRRPHVETRSSLFLGLVVIVMIAGCGRDPSNTKPEAGHKHEHVAPHGGTAVVLGDEAYHLELVRDANAGRLQAYVLDGHLENFVRIPAGSFEITARINGRDEVLAFKPVANPATGETAGNSALFEAAAPWLNTNASFDAVLRELTIRGSSFKNVEFNFPTGNDVAGK